MSKVNETVFSEYEVLELGFLLGPEEVYHVPCTGSVEEELTVKTVTKNCRGVVAKTRTFGTGNGTLKISAHVPIELYHKMHGFVSNGLVEGVYGYGKDSVHPEFGITAKVRDEDDNLKYKAYPRSIVQSNLSRPVENGADEVAELELEIAIMPDDNNMGLYEALDSDLKNETPLSSYRRNRLSRSRSRPIRGSKPSWMRFQAGKFSRWQTAARSSSPRTTIVSSS